jgi:hypothetical protein
MSPEIGNGYWFKSSDFEAEPGEDEETNPRMYGRQVASWLHERFQALGYEVEDVFGEDWGWCVMCQRDPYWLWVGCVNLRDYEHAQPDDPPPPADRLLWNVVPMAEVPFFKYLFKKKPDPRPGLDKIGAELKAILDSDPRVEVVDDELSNTWFDQFYPPPAN